VKLLEWGRIALQASVVINNIGVLIVYMIIIGILLNTLMLYAYVCMLLNIAPIEHFRWVVASYLCE
jgi:hypothetical protein